MPQISGSTGWRSPPSETSPSPKPSDQLCRAALSAATQTTWPMLIYTSGSTGEPKGIVYDHQHLLHGAWFWAEEHGMSESSVQLFKSPYFWAVMEWEVFPALIRGGKLVVASADGHKSPQYMAQTIEKFHVDVLMITPSVLDLLLDVAQVGTRMQLNGSTMCNMYNLRGSSFFFSSRMQAALDRAP